MEGNGQGKATLQPASHHWKTQLLQKDMKSALQNMLLSIGIVISSLCFSLIRYKMHSVFIITFVCKCLWAKMPHTWCHKDLSRAVCLFLAIITIIIITTIRSHSSLILIIFLHSSHAHANALTADTRNAGREQTQPPHTSILNIHPTVHLKHPS